MRWRNMRSSRLIQGVAAALVLVLLPNGMQAAESVPIRAGVAVTDITGDVAPAEVHDPLHAKVLVIEKDARPVVIVTLDLIGAPRPPVVSIRARAKKELGIDADRILINASHDHHTQGKVAKDLAARVVAAMRRAAETMVPVQLAVGVGREDRITMNRRLPLADGRTWTIRRANPSPPDAAVTGVGPLDPEIGVLRLDGPAGKPLAVVYNFAVHAYGGVPDDRVTADLPGFASAVLEETLGCPALFVQGAAGDITPILYKDVNAPPPTERLGMMLGLSTLAAVQRAKPSGSTTACTVDGISDHVVAGHIARRIVTLIEPTAPATDADAILVPLRHQRLPDQMGVALKFMGAGVPCLTEDDSATLLITDLISRRKHERGGIHRDRRRRT